MTLKEPNSVDECIYFTNRSLGKGKIKAWVFKEICVKCGKSLMGKPKDKKTGKAKIRASEYVCESCGHSVPKEQYEDSLNVNVKYVCPKCDDSGESSIPFKRRKLQRINEDTGEKETIEGVRFECDKCGEKIDITKKMK